LGLRESGGADKGGQALFWRIRLFLCRNFNIACYLTTTLIVLDLITTERWLYPEVLHLTKTTKNFLKEYCWLTHSTGVPLRC